MGRENRRKLEQHFCGLDGSISNIRKTGEVSYSHRLLAHTVRGNNRRKDASQTLVNFVREVERALNSRPAGARRGRTRRRRGRTRS